MSKVNQRQRANSLIRNYWTTFKKRWVLSKLKLKKKIPSFTRINGSRIQRLGRIWRYPTGRNTHKVLKPSIGYKRPSDLRFRRMVDGLLLRVIASTKEMNDIVLKPKQVFVIKKCVGARKRLQILEYAKTKDLPLYVNISR